MSDKAVNKQLGQSHDLILSNRGSSGLAIRWRVSDDSIAYVERLENLPANALQPGDPLQTRYRIHFVQKGPVTVSFFETQVWDDDFPEIALQQLSFVVA